jgi:hypothetical protein
MENLILSTITRITQTFKLIVDSKAMLDQAEMKKKLGDLYEELSTLKIKYLDENSELQSRIHALEEKLSDKNHLKYEYDALWYYDDAGQKVDGPFCHICYEKDGKKIHLEERYDGTLYCAACSRSCNGPNYDPKKRIRVINSFERGLI